MKYEPKNINDETVPRKPKFTSSPKLPFKVKAKLDLKSNWFPPPRLLLGLYDYRFKHLVVMEEKNHDVIKNLQVNGLAQFFGSEESESRTTCFQEGEDDEDMPLVT